MRRISGILLALATLALLARLAPDIAMHAGADTNARRGVAPLPTASQPAPEDAGGLIPEAQAATDNVRSDAQAGQAQAAQATKDAARPDDKALLALRERQKSLDARASALDRREQAIRKAEEALRARIGQLEQMLAAIRQRLDEEASIKNKKIKRLAAVYAAMKPDRAAPVIAKMELGTVVRIFLLMDEKRVGKILSFLPPDKAVRISQALTRNLSSL